MGTWITRSHIGAPKTWALWGSGQHLAEAKVAPSQLADTPEGQQLVRRAILGAEAKAEGAGTLVALLAWVPDRTTGAVEALGACWRLGWEPGTRITRDEYLANAETTEPSSGVTLDARTVTELDVDAGPAVVEGLVTTATSPRRFAGLGRPGVFTVGQVRCTIFPETCDEAFRIEVVVDNLDLMGRAAADIAAMARGLVLTLGERP